MGTPERRARNATPPLRRPPPPAFVRNTDVRGGVRIVVRRRLVGRIVHDLRRTAVRNLERAAVPRSVATQGTGHTTESVYRRYAIVAEADLREGVAKLASLAPRAGAHKAG